MLTYEQYKAKHEWATRNIDTFERRLADGQARLEATHGELRIATDEHTTASAKCLQKPTDQVTPDEWAKFDSTLHRVTDLRGQCDAIEQDNSVSEKGLDNARQFRTELEGQYPEHHEQHVSEQRVNVPEAPADTSEMSPGGKRMQAYAGVMAVAVNLNTAAPDLPSSVETVRAVDPAAYEKQELKELEFDNLPSSMRDRIREESKPVESPLYEQGPPQQPQMAAWNDPRLSYNVPLPQEYGSPSTPGQQVTQQPLDGPKDNEIPQATSKTPETPLLTYDKTDQKLLTYDGPKETPLLTYDKANQKQLTYDEPKLITDQRTGSDTLKNESTPPGTSTLTNTGPASSPPAPADNVPTSAPAPPAQQPPGPTL
jgi:hypothetical protein